MTGRGGERGGERGGRGGGGGSERPMKRRGGGGGSGRGGTYTDAALLTGVYGRLLLAPAPMVPPMLLGDGRGVLLGEHVGHPGVAGSVQATSGH